MSNKLNVKYFHDFKVNILILTLLILKEKKKTRKKN